MFFFFFWVAGVLCSPGWLQTGYVAKDGLELPILLPLPPKCWDCRHTSLCRVHVVLGLCARQTSTLPAKLQPQVSHTVLQHLEVIPSLPLSRGSKKAKRRELPCLWSSCTRMRPQMRPSFQSRCFLSSTLLTRGLQPLLPDLCKTK